MTTTEVENFPGFPDGVMGPELMDNMRKQAERFGAEFITDDATRGRPDRRRSRRVWVGETAYRARAVILATGSAWRPLGVPGEQELLGHGVSSCATCDGFFFRGQHIVGRRRRRLGDGGGDVPHPVRRDASRSSTGATSSAPARSWRSGRWPTRRSRSSGTPWSTEILGADGKVAGVRVRNVHHRRRARCSTSTGVFVAIGHDPRSELFARPGRHGRRGLRRWSTRPSTRTNLPGVFAAGDLVDHTYRQAITAAGTGCAAALDAERFIAAPASGLTPLTARPPADRRPSDRTIDR